MTKVKFGPIYTRIEDIMGPVELAEKAESWGYDSFWVPDYVLKPRLDALIVLGAAAQRTSTIQLGTAVMVLPYKDPLILAKSALSVDVLSNGRLLLGVGIGANPREFDVMGLDIRYRGRVSDERLDIMSRILDGKSVTHHGRFHSFEDVSIGPPSVSKPRIPIWLGAHCGNGWAEGALRRTGKYGDGFIPTEATIEQYKDAMARISRYAEDAGRDPSSIEWGIFIFIIMEDSREYAERKGFAELADRLDRDYPLVHGRAAAAGTVDECIEAIQAYVDIGVTHFIFDSASPAEEIVEQYERAAKEIVPHFR